MKDNTQNPEPVETDLKDENTMNEQLDAKPRKKPQKTATKALTVAGAVLLVCAVGYTGGAVVNENYNQRANAELVKEQYNSYKSASTQYATEADAIADTAQGKKFVEEYFPKLIRPTEDNQSQKEYYYENAPASSFVKPVIDLFASYDNDIDGHLEEMDALSEDLMGNSLKTYTYNQANLICETTADAKEDKVIDGVKAGTYDTYLLDFGETQNAKVLFSYCGYDSDKVGTALEEQITKLNSELLKNENTELEETQTTAPTE